MPTRDEIIRIVAETLGGEARGGGVSAMTDVASVIGTRAANPGPWGTDLYSVCLHHGSRTYAFSCQSPTDVNYRIIKAATASDPWFVVAEQVATSLVDGKLEDTVQGADSYYATSSLAPYWAAPPAVHLVTKWMHSFWRTRISHLVQQVPNLSAHADDLNAAELARIRTEYRGVVS